MRQGAVLGQNALEVMEGTCFWILKTSVKTCLTPPPAKKTQQSPQPTNQPTNPKLSPPKITKTNWQLISVVSFGLLKAFCQLHSRLKFVCFMVVPTLSCEEKSKGFFDGLIIIQKTWNWIKTDMLVQDYGALPDLCRKKVYTKCFGWGHCHYSNSVKMTN